MQKQAALISEQPVFVIVSCIPRWFIGQWEWVQIGVFSDFGDKCWKVGKESREAVIHRKIGLPTGESSLLRCCEWIYSSSIEAAFPRGWTRGSFQNLPYLAVFFPLDIVLLQSSYQNSAVNQEIAYGKVFYTVANDDFLMTVAILIACAVSIMDFMLATPIIPQYEKVFIFKYLNLPYQRDP